MPENSSASVKYLTTRGGKRSSKRCKAYKMNKTRSRGGSEKCKSERKSNYKEILRMRDDGGQRMRSEKDNSNKS